MYELGGSFKCRRRGGALRACRAVLRPGVLMATSDADAVSLPAPSAAFVRLAALADMQPLTSLCAAVPGVVEWKPCAVVFCAAVSSRVGFCSLTRARAVGFVCRLQRGVFSCSAHTRPRCVHQRTWPSTGAAARRLGRPACSWRGVCRQANRRDDQGTARHAGTSRGAAIVTNIGQSSAVAGCVKHEDTALAGCSRIC